MSVEKQGGNKKYFFSIYCILRKGGHPKQFVSTVLTQMRIIIILNMCVK